MKYGKLLGINRVEIYDSSGIPKPMKNSALNCFFEVIMDGGGIVSIHASTTKWVVKDDLKEITAIVRGRNLTIMGPQDKMYSHMLDLGMFIPNVPDKKAGTKRKKASKTKKVAKTKIKGGKKFFITESGG